MMTYVKRPTTIGGLAIAPARSFLFTAGAVAPLSGTAGPNL